jgi:azurin
MKKFSLILASALIAAPAFAADVKLELTGNDAMQFSTKTLEATAGDNITLTFKHIGQLPVQAMGHNVVVLKPGTAIPTVAMKAVTAKDTEYVPADAETKALIVTHTKLIGGGQSDTITFKIDEPGVYPFFCSFPGHFANMAGTLTIKAK